MLALFASEVCVEGDATYHEGSKAGHREGIVQMMRRRTLLASGLLLCIIVSAHADSHIYLSCSLGRVETTTFEDGHVRTRREKAPASGFLIDIDFEHKTINGTYDAPDGQRFENASVTIGGFAGKPASDHEAGYQDAISIDRLSGTATITHRYEPPDDCADRSDRVGSCSTWETTTIYHCLPAATDFPTPIPKMMRLWQRLRHSYLMSRVRRMWHRLTTSVERQSVKRQMSPSPTDKSESK